jgi:hypothetical protein
LYQGHQNQPWKGPNDDEKSGDREGGDQRGDGTRLNASRACLVKYSFAADQLSQGKIRRMIEEGGFRDCGTFSRGIDDRSVKTGGGLRKSRRCSTRRDASCRKRLFIPSFVLE